MCNLLPSFSRTAVFRIYPLPGLPGELGEYKVMGLAPYGEPVYREQILEELVDLRGRLVPIVHGSFRILDSEEMTAGVSRALLSCSSYLKASLKPSI